VSNPVKLSVLDQTPVIDGYRVVDAVAATVELAQLADDLGYTRYWCAEHHGLHAVANPAPEVMIARLAAATRRIRVGSGGVMLPYYSAFKVAEQFRMLEALFPGRIDLGVGRAPGGDMATARAVAAGRFDSDVFPQQVADLAMLLSGRLPPDHYAANVVLQPQIQTQPELWMLGSSDFGGALAAEVGIRFAFAHFISPRYGDAVARMYREQFKPGHDTAPYNAVALFVICADDAATAADLAAAVDLRRVQMAFGINAPIPTVAQGRAQRYGERELAIIEDQRPRSLIGTPEQVVGRMLELKELFAADEIIVLTVAASYAARLRSYQLLAEAFELS